MTRPYIGGYRRDLEDVEALEQSALELPIFEGYRAAPPVENPWDLLKMEYQASQGACQGCALSDCAEKAVLDATGEYEQLSKQYAYIETQRIDGLIGSDRGSTIWGGVQLAKTRGLCREELWPYTGKYHTRPPVHSLEECYADAASRKIENHVKMTGYDSILQFIEAGLGAISIGIAWNNSCEAKVTSRYQRRGGGGHAITLPFKSPRLNASGQNFIWMKNSWSERWGNRGWSEWSPEFINDLFEDRYTVAYGLTDMKNPEPRPVNYLGRLG
jgi:hypothetical protein